MKDFHPAIEILVRLPDWCHDYISTNEYPGDLTASQELWLFLFCYEARNNP